LGWDGNQRSRLWRYNQHYFDDLNAKESESRSRSHHRLIHRWIKENPPASGTGWEPYPLSLRIVNWVKWQLSGNAITGEGLESLFVQARWLFQNIEWHILGNHLFANAKALVFAGLFYDGSEAQIWLAKGLKIITTELSEQVLPDGGNFERSPMYHAIFLEDILDLINLIHCYPGVVRTELEVQLRATAKKMLVWLDAMCHPDKEISFFNDSAIGIAPSPCEIQSYAMRLGILYGKEKQDFKRFSCMHFVESGYIRLSSRNAVVLLDVAPIGPDYLPGHAHADTLAFEMSLFGVRVIVNGGTSKYGSDVVRLIERGTAAHSTVEINGLDSSEVWSGFRVARRAYPMDLKVKEDRDGVSVACSHNGYMRLPGRNIHRRFWQFFDGRLVVKDEIEGRFETAVARFHFHPDIQIVAKNQSSFLLCLPYSGREIQVIIISGVASIESSNYAPEFGIKLSSRCLSVRFESSRAIAVEFLWSNND